MSGSADFFGIPEYFVTNVTCEGAGRGNIRIYCSTLRGNALVPQFSVVMSLSDTMDAVVTVKQRAAELWSDAMMPIPELELN